MPEPLNLHVGTGWLLWGRLQLVALPSVPLDRRALRRLRGPQPVWCHPVALSPTPASTAAPATLAAPAVSAAATARLQPDRAAGRQLQLQHRLRGLLHPCQQMPEPLGGHVRTHKLLQRRLQHVPLPSVPLDWRALRRPSWDQPLWCHPAALHHPQAATTGAFSATLALAAAAFSVSAPALAATPVSPPPSASPASSLFGQRAVWSAAEWL